MNKGIGFYWTLPIKWAGFDEIGPEAEQAAQDSWTISLQRDVVRRWAKGNGFELVEEHAVIEDAPDRGSEEMVQKVRALAERAKAIGARILLVDFGHTLGQRTHLRLRHYVEANKCLFQQIAPLSDHENEFREHFKFRRRQQAEWTAGKDDRIAAAQKRAAELQAEGLRLDAVAWELDQEKLRSPTGKAWTADMLRKVLKKPVE